MPSEWDDDLKLALSLADAADVLSLSRFRASDLVIDTKPDLTPVTDADKAVEKIIRARLAIDRPGDAVLGEEGGETGAGARRRWILDPIDGTKNYARGVPVWATLLALETASKIVIGVVSAPALGRRWWAAAGGGSWTLADSETAGGTPRPRPIAVSAVDRMQDASLSYSSLSGWQERGQLPGFLDLCAAAWRTRAYGDFWSYMLLAEGAVDIAAEPTVSLWDLAALDIVVREAGGTFTALDGAAGPYGGSAVASNGRLHDDARRILTGQA